MINRQSVSVGLAIVSSTLIFGATSLPSSGFPQSANQSLLSLEQSIAANPSTYIVKLGDTLSGIAYKSGLSVSKLLEYNPNLRSNPRLIRVGQVINLSPNSPPQEKPKVSSRPKVETIWNIPSQRRTGSSRVGSKRGSGKTCLKNPNDQTKILLPETNFGYTLQDYPTFFWYIPELAPNELSTEPIEIEFRLIEVRATETENKTIYTTTWKNFTPGIASFTLSPDDNAPLEDYPAILAKGGVWYDSLAILSALRREQPNDTVWKNDWAEMLKKIGFGSLKDVPEIQVTPEPKTKK